MNTFTRPIPDDCCWSFGSKVYEDFDSFYTALVQYNLEIVGRTDQLQDHPISRTNEVKLTFCGYQAGSEELVDLEITLSSEKQKQLTFLEFMYLANNSLHPYLCESDHHYYEGIHPRGESNGIMVYELIQGS
jgi:hypothetical protein